MSKQAFIKVSSSLFFILLHLQQLCRPSLRVFPYQEAFTHLSYATSVSLWCLLYVERTNHSFHFAALSAATSNVHSSDTVIAHCGATDDLPHVQHDYCLQQPEQPAFVFSIFCSMHVQVRPYFLAYLAGPDNVKDIEVDL